MNRLTRGSACAALILGITFAAGNGPALADNNAPQGTAAAAALETFDIHVTSSNLSMVVKSASTANEASVIQYRFYPGGDLNDLMALEWVGSSNWLRIKPVHTYTNDGNVHNDKCLAVKGASNTSGAFIVNANCSYDKINNDVWIADTASAISPITGQGEQGYQFRNLKSNMCITVKGNSTAQGALLIQYDCRGMTANSVWGPVPA